MRNRGDRRGLNPRQLEPQGRTRAEFGNSYRHPSGYQRTLTDQEIAGRTSESVPGPDISQALAAMARRGVW